VLGGPELLRELWRTLASAEDRLVLDLERLARRVSPISYPNIWAAFRMVTG